MSRPGVRLSSALTRDGAAALLFIVLTGTMLFPVVQSMGSGVPGWEGDNLFYVRGMWWMKHALLDLHRSPLVNPTAYVPVGRDLARGEMTPANTVLGLPLTALMGPVAAYNGMVLFSFVATGFATYLWVTQLTGRRAAGLVAGTIAAFMPFRFAHLPGHLPQLTTQWLPATLFAFERFLARRTIGRATLLGAMAALVALGCWYYGFSLALVLPLYVVVRTWPTPAVWRELAWWRGVAAALAVATVLLLPFAIPLVRLAAGDQIERRFADVERYSLNVDEFFAPNRLHPLAAPADPVALVERQVALGFTACALALVGVVAARRRRPVVWALVAVWVVTYVIALGPTLHAGDRQVTVRVSAAMFQRAHAWFTEATSFAPAARGYLEPQRLLPIPLPAAWLYWYVPFAAGMRVMARFGVWTALATAALAGYGVVRVIDACVPRAGRRVAAVLVGGLVAAVACESLSAITILPVRPRPVDVWLASQPATVVITEAPFAQANRPFQDYWATVHQKAMVLGWIGDSFPPPVFRDRARALRRFPDDVSLDQLHSVGVTYVLITPAAVADWSDLAARIAAQPRLAPDRTIGDVRLYRVAR